jgi:hypothetical protein
MSNIEQGYFTYDSYSALVSVLRARLTGVSSIAIEIRQKARISRPKEKE